MSRRDYIAIAAVLRDAVLTPRQRDDLVSRFAALFHSDNPRFDSTRFAQAVPGRPRHPQKGDDVNTHSDHFNFGLPADLSGGCPIQAVYDLDSGAITRAEYDAILAAYDEAENIRLARASALLA